jgi:hypothetical protein
MVFIYCCYCCCYSFIVLPFCIHYYCIIIGTLFIVIYLIVGLLDLFVTFVSFPALLVRCCFDVRYVVVTFG